MDCYKYTNYLLFLHKQKIRMKKLLTIIVLSLLLITPSQANDIEDFEIDGIFS